MLALIGILYLAIMLWFIFVYSDASLSAVFVGVLWPIAIPLIFLGMAIIFAGAAWNHRSKKGK